MPPVCAIPIKDGRCPGVAKWRGDERGGKNINLYLCGFHFKERRLPDAN